MLATSLRRTLFKFRQFSPVYCDLRNMCILFVHNASDISDSDYRMIIASNRDEYYDRPAANLAPWNEDPAVIGGRDLEAGCDGGTWLAISPLRNKIGVLLNIPTDKIPNAKTRGKLVADFVKSDASSDEYIQSMKGYATECNHFNFVAIDIGSKPKLVTYSNLTDSVRSWPDQEFGVSNSLPESPLKKVVAGKQRLKKICSAHKKIQQKGQLVDQLIEFLKSREHHLPDNQLQNREQASSIYVCIPEKRYGTRTHTLILITKSGHVDVIEMTMQAPIDAENPKWTRTEMSLSCTN